MMTLASCVTIKHRIEMFCDSAGLGGADMLPSAAAVEAEVDAGASVLLVSIVSRAYDKAGKGKGRGRA